LNKLSKKELEEVIKKDTKELLNEDYLKDQEELT
jgi:hypothetical protein